MIGAQCIDENVNDSLRSLDAVRPGRQAGLAPHRGSTPESEGTFLLRVHSKRERHGLAGKVTQVHIRRLPTIGRGNRPLEHYDRISTFTYFDAERDRPILHRAHREVEHGLRRKRHGKTRPFR